jgi:gliding motility-associated-like protein
LKKVILGSLFFFLSVSAFATHIVGGGFTLRHIADDQYELTMEFYRDCGPNSADFDPTVRVGIYDKATNINIDKITLQGDIPQLINFGNVDCIEGASSCLEKRNYRATISLTEAKYNNISGYYVSWERCCRNVTIVNIISPDETGMVFYMEFPSPHPPTVPATGFINSTPRFTVDPINYICINDNFTYNFHAIDEDGDSLSYSLITPLKGNTGPFDPNGNSTLFQAAPYEEVAWEFGYGIDVNIMDGNPDLAVDPLTGEFSVIAKQQGLYVFTILCEEFRNGVKIGEIRRDIQYTTVFCKPQYTPQITTNASPSGLIAKINEEKCFQVFAKDSNVNDSVTIVFLGVDEGNAITDFIFQPVTGIKTASTTFCFTPRCTDTLNNTIHLRFLVYDNSCPRPRYDTLIVPVTIIKGKQIAPIIFADSASLSFHLDEIKCFDIYGLDSNIADSVVLSYVGIQGGGAFSNITFNITNGIKNASAEVCITPTCSDNIFGDVNLIFVVRDNSCSGALRDTLFLPITIINNTFAPQIFIADSSLSNLVINVNESKCFPIFGVDSNVNDSVEIQFMGIDEGNDVLSDYSFQNVAGVKEVYSTFCISYHCEDAARDSVHIRFLVKDNSCPVPLYDTLVLVFRLFNTTAAPKIFSDIAPQNLFVNIDERKCFPIFGSDINVEDSIEIIFLGEENGKEIFDLSFQKVSGKQSLSTRVCLTVTCDDHTGGNVNLKFLIRDNSACRLTDTLSLPLEIRNGNIAPEIFTDNHADHIDIRLNEQQCLPIFGTDLNLSDSIKISFLGTETGTLITNFSFQETSGMENIVTEACFKLLCTEVTEDSMYLRFLIRDNSCVIPLTDTLRIFVRVIDDGERFDLSKIPNVFTPNGDDMNDVFSIHEYPGLECFRNFSIDIFNRWGRKVYESVNPQFEWNGDDLPVDTYFYVLKINEMKRTGNVMIIR